MFGADEEKIRLQVKVEGQEQTIAELRAKLAACDPAAADEAAPSPTAPTPATPTKTAPAAQPASAGAETSAPDPGDASQSGEIEVKATVAVQVLIDGKALLYNPLKSGYVKRGLSAGPHLIETQTSGIKQVNWSSTVTVPGGKRLRFQHKLGQSGLTQLETVDAKGSD